MYSDKNTPKGGFPHSEICGSKVTGTSPQLIAACHVFHRLYTPRHPPNALMTLENSSISSDKIQRSIKEYEELFYFSFL